MVRGSAVFALFLVLFAAAHGESDTPAISWQAISLAVDGRKVLKNLNGVAYPGRLLAIMGPSGAGKTSLLQVLGGTLSQRPRQKLSGRLSGSAYHGRIDRTYGFVGQEDQFFSHLSVQETLQMAAKLRLPGTSTAHRKEVGQRRSGGDWRAGGEDKTRKKGKEINGGEGEEEERRRGSGEKKKIVEDTPSIERAVVNRGLEMRGREEYQEENDVDLLSLLFLLIQYRARILVAIFILSLKWNSPDIIFADEPTSGLDAFQAERMILVLRKLADSGHTGLAYIG
ncbi:hypothetical protein GUITHDRAFT_132316 [Guillardia theta CCMP2712]|uniref:ABC transporter domain-containing protein n=1 Tax=Guillardia theta (strain CCMP2712) TaxID=905079 RepID=L1K217_GUITC|nr:hypothetical protein GUITHDRAFT_132316 [Guillardia theta CCMP2712]EKX54624.1 hypothetical protein GUITHDRAFT_132316 [Guillardia theta CCMP2712]|eukprot:XP_005841604.1 hypothetical protein GUITHDRAFT_132316 [Guillardia theta CCMP2712]